MKQVTIIYSDVSHLRGELLERQEKAMETLERDVAVAMGNINQPDQTVNSQGYTPAQIGKVQIREAKTWFHSGAYGKVSVIVR